MKTALVWQVGTGVPGEPPPCEASWREQSHMHQQLCVSRTQPIEAMHNVIEV